MMSDKDCKDLDQMLKDMKDPLYKATKKEVDANKRMLLSTSKKLENEYMSDDGAE